MANKKHEQSSFKVTDRRLFTSDGELRSEVIEESEAPKAAPTPPKETTAEQTPAPVATADKVEDGEMPVPPTSAEQDAQAAAYKQSSHDLDKQVELSGHSAKDFEITFGSFMACLYMP